MKGQFLRAHMRDASKLKNDVEAADGEPALGEELSKTIGGDGKTPPLPGDGERYEGAPQPVAEMPWPQAGVRVAVGGRAFEPCVEAW